MATEDGCEQTRVAPEPSIEDLQHAAQGKPSLTSEERDSLVAAGEDLQTRFGLSPLALLRQAAEAETTIRRLIPTLPQFGEDLPTREIVAALMEAAPGTPDVVFSPTFLEWLSVLRMSRRRKYAPGAGATTADLAEEVDFFRRSRKSASSILDGAALGRVGDALALRQKGTKGTRTKSLIDSVYEDSALSIYRLVLKTLQDAEERVPVAVTDPAEIRRHLESLGSPSLFIDRFADELARHRVRRTTTESGLTLRGRAALFLSDLEAKDGSGAFLPRPLTPAPQLMPL